MVEVIVLQVIVLGVTVYEVILNRVWDGREGKRGEGGERGGKGCQHIFSTTQHSHHTP